MSLTYVIRRILLFFVVVWAATTLSFFCRSWPPAVIRSSNVSA